MKKTLLGICLALALATQAWAVAAPTNVSVGPYDATTKSAALYWDANASVDQWLIYFNGTQRYVPFKTQVGATSTARTMYVMTGIAAETLPVSITLRALIPGYPMSSPSTAVTLNPATDPGLQPANVSSLTLTATAAWTYVALTCTAQPCNIRLFNQSSASTLVYWIDRSSDTPAFAGMSITPGTLPVIEDIAVGDYLHWRWSQSWTGNGFLQTRY